MNRRCRSAEGSLQARRRSSPLAFVRRAGSLLLLGGALFLPLAHVCCRRVLSMTSSLILYEPCNSRHGDSYTRKWRWTQKFRYSMSEFVAAGLPTTPICFSSLLSSFHVVDTRIAKCARSCVDPGAVNCQETLWSRGLETG